MRFPLTLTCGLAGAIAGAALVHVAMTAPETSPFPMPVIDRGEIGCTTDAECEALDGDIALLATECGPDKITTFGREEDELAGVAPGEMCKEIIRVRVVGEWRQG